MAHKKVKRMMWNLWHILEIMFLRIFGIPRETKKQQKTLEQILEIMFNDHLERTAYIMGRRKEPEHYVLLCSSEPSYTKEERKAKGIVRVGNHIKFGHYLIVTKNSEHVVYLEKKKALAMQEHFKKREEVGWEQSVPPRSIYALK